MSERCPIKEVNVALARPFVDHFELSNISKLDEVLLLEENINQVLSMRKT